MKCSICSAFVGRKRANAQFEVRPARFGSPSAFKIVSDSTAATAISRRLASDHKQRNPLTSFVARAPSEWRRVAASDGECGRRPNRVVSERQFAVNMLFPRPARVGRIFFCRVIRDARRLLLLLRRRHCRYCRRHRRRRIVRMPSKTRGTTTTSTLVVRNHCEPSPPPTPRVVVSRGRVSERGAKAQRDGMRARARAHSRRRQRARACKFIRRSEASGRWHSCARVCGRRRCCCRNRLPLLLAAAPIVCRRHARAHRCTAPRSSWRSKRVGAHAQRRDSLEHKLAD